MIKNNIKGFVARDFVIAMLIFSATIALFVLMVGSIANDYGNTNMINPEFSNKFDQFSNDTQIAKEMWNATTSEGGLSLFGAADLFFFSTFKVISLVFESVKVAGLMLITFPTFFGIDDSVAVIFISLIMAILGVLIVFIVISSLRSGSKF